MDQPIAKLPLNLVRDAVQLLIAAKHIDYAMKDVMIVVNALNQFAEAAVREYGSGQPENVSAFIAPAESGTDQPPPQ